MNTAVARTAAPLFTLPEGLVEAATAAAAAAGAGISIGICIGSAVVWDVALSAMQGKSGTQGACFYPRDGRIVLAQADAEADAEAEAETQEQAETQEEAAPVAEEHTKDEL